MDATALFDEPSRRRWWLLSKALELAPLDEALKLAQAAEDFLNGSLADDADESCPSARQH